MKQSVTTPYGIVRIGTPIRIVKVKDDTKPSTAFPVGIDYQARALNGKTGTVTCIDDSGALHGTWGSLSIIPEVDRFEITGNPINNEQEKS